jgi:prepilin-type processing-associated H-X9-DG protein
VDLQTGSWGYCVLPYLEQENAVRADAQSEGGPMFGCPTRGRNQPQALRFSPDPVYTGTTYVNQSGRNPWCKTDYAVNWFLIVNRWWAGGCPLIGLPTRLADVTDGTSQTLLLGEKAMEPKAYNTGGWFFDEPIWAGGSSGTARKLTTILRDAPDIPIAFTWGGPHPAGAQFAYADGSVRLVRFGTDPNTVAALLSPGGGEVVSSE